MVSSPMTTSSSLRSELAGATPFRFRVFSSVGRATGFHPEDAGSRPAGRSNYIKVVYFHGFREFWTTVSTMPQTEHCIDCKWHRDGFCTFNPPRQGPERQAPVELRYPAVRPRDDGPCRGFEKK